MLEQAFSTHEKNLKNYSQWADVFFLLSPYRSTHQYTLRQTLGAFKLADEITGLFDGHIRVEDFIQSRVSLFQVQEVHELLHSQVRLFLCTSENKRSEANKMH